MSPHKFANLKFAYGPIKRVHPPLVGSHPLILKAEAVRISEIPTLGCVPTHLVCVVLRGNAAKPVEAKARNAHCT
jgi:hypothetical protein